MADTITTDVAIVGAGIAGAGLAADLAGDFGVVLIEQESRPGYHSTGRSAAIFIQNYGNSGDPRADPGELAAVFTAGCRTVSVPLVSQRGLLYVADEDRLDQHAALLAEGEGLRELSLDEARAMVPLLRPEWLRAAAYEHDAQDIDVAALHQGWLKKAKAGGTKLLTDAVLSAARFEKGRWRSRRERPSSMPASSSTRPAPGPMVWRRRAGSRRSASSRCAAPWPCCRCRRSSRVRRWPLIADSAEGWYAKPEAGRLQVSPDDEDPVEPHDAFVDDMVMAEGLYRFEQAMDFPVTRVEASWAGLRSFAPDRTPVAGFDRTADRFFLAGGAGRLRHPDVARLVAARRAIDQARLCRRRSGRHRAGTVARPLPQLISSPTMHEEKDSQ